MRLGSDAVKSGREVESGLCRTWLASFAARINYSLCFWEKNKQTNKKELVSL